MHVVPLDRHIAGRCERQLAREHLVQDTAECVQVGWRAHCVGEGLLGSHVRRGAHCLTDHGELAALASTEQCGNPEVEHLYDTPGSEEQVSGLDVTVYH